MKKALKYILVALACVAILSVMEWKSVEVTNTIAVHQLNDGSYWKILEVMPMLTHTLKAGVCVAGMLIEIWMFIRDRKV